MKAEQCTDYTRDIEADQVTFLEGNIVFANKPQERPFHEMENFEESCFCTECGKTLLSSEFSEHLFSHVEFQAFQDDESPSAVSENNFESISEPVPCKVCRKNFGDLKSMRMHVKSHHVQKTYECLMCGLSFQTFSRLSKHREDRHTTELQLFCDICGMMFHHSIQLKSHMNAHSNYQSYLCSECGKTFNLAVSLKAHQKTHSSPAQGTLNLSREPHVCRVCGTIFGNISGLKSHSKIHTNRELYKCSICGKEYLRKGALESHYPKCLSYGHYKLLKVIRTYQCVHCKRKFNRNGSHKCVAKQLVWSQNDSS